MTTIVSEKLKAEVRNLSLYYTEVQALKRVNLPIAVK